jgi:aspartate/methionine/tyrosine aminotransferase
MELPPFLLDQWLGAYQFADPPIRFNLASSTGPRWTLEQVQALGAGLDLSRIAISYAPPQGSAELRRAIAAHHEVDPDWVIVTTGAAEALSILYCLASEPGREIALPDPGFPAFSALAAAWQLKPRMYRLSRDQRWALTAELVVGSITDRSVLALVNSPHNPTGSVMPRDEIARLAAALAEREAPLIVDEVYHPLYFAEAQPSAAGLENVIVIGDMSKAMSLAGTRIGWIIDADAERRRRMIDARSYLTICSSPVSEAIAAHALSNSAPILARLRAVANDNLRRLKEVIDSSDLLEWVEPQGGTTVYPWFQGGLSSRSFCERLASRGVLVAPGDCFGQAEHMRIGFAAQEDGFAEALDILSETLAEELVSTAAG